MSSHEKKQHESRTVDVRHMPPAMRHSHIEKIFGELGPGEELLVVNDHEPVHLLQFMRHERKDFDASSYKAYRKSDSEWVAVFRKKADETSSGTAAAEDFVFASIESERTVSPDSFSPVPVYSTDEYKVIMAYFNAGQFIPVHAPGNDVIIFVYSGEGEVVASSRRFGVKRGDMVVVRRGIKRGIIATSDMQILHIVIPPPGEADHGNIAEMIRKGKFE